MDWQSARWLNAPTDFALGDNTLQFTTQSQTDFWQRTNYGMRADNGHAYLFDVSENDFSFTVRVKFRGEKLYDQAGIIIYHDSDHWLKSGVEHLRDNRKILSSVVTQHGYSDWALSPYDEAIATDTWRYRLSKKGDDFLIETMNANDEFVQIRMFHSFVKPRSFGVYACSPKDGSFTAHFSEFALGVCKWSHKTHV